MRISKSIIIFIFILIQFYGKAQVDSLLKAYNKAVNDTDKFNLLSQIYSEYIKVGKNAGADKVTKEIIRLSEKIDNEKYKATAYQTRANYFYKNNIHDSAIAYDLRSIEIAKPINHRKSLIRCYINLANIYNQRADYAKALQWFQDAEQQCIMDKDTTGRIIVFINSGNIYYTMSDYRQAKNYFKKAEAICLLRSENKLQLASVYNNLATIYLNENPIKRDSAMIYYEKFQGIAKELGDERDIALAYFNIGETYRSMGNLKSAKENYFKSKELYGKIEDTTGLMRTLLGLGDTYVLEDRGPEAIEALKQALSYSVKYKLITNKCDIEQSLANAYYKMGNYKKAFDYFKEFSITSDSVYNADNSAILYEMQTKYETQEKEKQNKLLEAENIISHKTIRQQQLLTYFIIAGLLLTIVFAVFILRGLRKQRQANRIISLQKEEVHRQKEIIEEKQKEILDSIHYAKRIQDTLLANKQLVSSVLKEFFIFFQPKDIVSGDFYWATKTEKYFFLALCDSTGHGVPGAFMSLLNIGFLSEAINEKALLSPADIFNYVRNRLENSISMEGQKDGFDGVLIRIDFSTREIVYAAANNKPVIVNSSGVFVQRGDKMPVGLGERKEPFNEYTLEYKNGDTLFLYTDGFADQFGGSKGKKFKYKPLDEFLQSGLKENMETQQDRLKNKFSEWKGDLEQVDDVCVIGIRL